MLINKEWSAPKRLTYGKNVVLQYSKPGFSVKVFNENGHVYEKSVQEGKQLEIRAADIMAIARPMISLKTEFEAEIHVHVDCPEF